MRAILRRFSLVIANSRSSVDATAKMESKACRLASLIQQLRNYERPTSSDVEEGEDNESDAKGGVFSQVGLSESTIPSVPRPERLRHKKAAVLICLFEADNGELRVILTKRSSSLSTHSGEVSLPGGKADEGDVDDVDTAKREAKEEIGLPPELVTVVTVMEPFLSKHLLRVIPVIGILSNKDAFVPVANPDEVDAVFDAPLEMFLKDENRRSEEKEWMGNFSKCILCSDRCYKGVMYLIGLATPDLTPIGCFRWQKATLRHEIHKHCRGEEQEEKQEADMRPKVVLFGDSITEMAFENGGWSSYLANHFCRKADVVLRGYSGYNTRWALKMVDRVFDGIRPSEAVAVVVFFGANDAALADRSSSFQHVPIPEYKTNLKAIISFIKEKIASNAVVVLITPPPIDEDGRIKNPYGDNTTGLPERTNSHAGAYAEACKSVAMENNLPVLDLWSKMQEFPHWEKTFLSDGLHLTGEGNKVVFEELVSKLKEQGISIETLPTDLPLFSDIDPLDPLKSFNI